MTTSFKKCFGIIFLKLLLLLVISFFADKFIEYAGFFPYIESLKMLDIPKFIYSFGNFDGIQYIKIAQGGYNEWQQAYFPLFPLLIHFLKPIIKNNLYAGLLISNLSFGIGLYYFIKLFKPKNNWLLVFLITFPTSFYFNVSYTEGLFFMLFVLSIYYLKNNKYVFASILASFASATRLIGSFLAIPFFFEIIFNKKYKQIVYLIFPFLGLFLYMTYLYLTTGNPLYFFTSQPIFGANRSTHLILPPQVIYRYLKIFFTAQFNFQYFIAVLEFVFFIFTTTLLTLDLIKIISLSYQKSIIKKEELGLINKALKQKKGYVSFLEFWKFGILEFYSFEFSLNLFSWANTILPTLTGTFSSIPRYSLFSISIFIYLSQIKNLKIKYLISLIFILLQIILFSLFIQGYFIA